MSESTPRATPAAPAQEPKHHWDPHSTAHALRRKAPKHPPPGWKPRRK
jgi:hypothetical protein